jgi:hypothetical protein
MPKKVKGAIYADDLVLSVVFRRKARSRIQTALNTLQKWAEAWLITVNTTKTAYTISLSTKHQQTRLTLKRETS